MLRSLHSYPQVCKARWSVDYSCDQVVMNSDTSVCCDATGEDSIIVRCSIIEIFAGFWCMMLVQSLSLVELCAHSLGCSRQTSLLQSSHESNLLTLMIYTCLWLFTR